MNPGIRYFLRLALLLLPATLLAACLSQSAGQPSEERLSLRPCHLAAPGLPLRLPARCGKLSVFENRAAQSGRRIELNVALLPAKGKEPATDPLFFLAGGPGQAATESFLTLSPAFELINQKRDIVLVDQRGTGGSNPLSCPESEAEVEFLEGDPEQIRSRVARCLAELDADPTLYTTAIAMEDLDEVRAALGYEQINLYGVSYGSRAALVYLRQYPGRVRTAILDGLAPPDLPLGLGVARDAQRALDLIFARCAADPACHEHFPELRSDWERLMARVSEESPEVTIQHPISNEPQTVRLTREELASTIRLLSYSAETVALLPLLIHHASESGDLDTLAAQYLLVQQQLTGSLNSGLSASVLCSEDAPFIDEEEAAQANANSYLGDLQTEQLALLCSAWPRGEIDPDFKEPVHSEVPTLLLSGEFDPVTPPAYAEQAAEGLPNSLHLVAPGQGHNVFYRGCIPRLASRFIEAGTIEGLDGSCVEKIEPMPFFTSFTGP